jgi:predicted nucleic acid-binding protein
MASSRSTQVLRNFDVTPLLSTLERERSWMCDILTEFEASNPVTDRAPPMARTIASTRRRYALSAYDAVYLALAIRLELASAAKDGPLVEAARRAGIAFA